MLLCRISDLSPSATTYTQLPRCGFPRICGSVSTVYNAPAVITFYGDVYCDYPFWCSMFHGLI
ncbi:hypothetical protein NC651_024819 [Populus alba x Populus x berolinensis]|nr:hypothetical protein NC651_024814 [Populus alba x Populus x berolinensis]KAJ6891435.1 hypothetical protein NC651_024819 [Populus alba x Populus x berolinensis]